MTVPELGLAAYSWRGMIYAASWVISTYTPYDRIEAIHSCRNRCFAHRPLRRPDRGAALGRRERLPCAAARCDGGRGRDAGRIAAVRRHAFRLALIRFPDTIPSHGEGAVTQAPPPKPRPQPQQETQQQHPNPQREAKEVPAPRQPASEATQAELVRTEKTEPEWQNQSSERQSAVSPPGTDTRTTKDRRSGRTIRGSGGTAGQRLCRAAG